MLLKSPGLLHTPSSYTACISACEACLAACDAASTGGGKVNGTGAVVDLASCARCCEIAIHAMEDHRSDLAAACAACARCCEALARDCMLFATPELGRCAQACYRAAQECRRLAFAQPQWKRSTIAPASGPRVTAARPQPHPH